MRFGLGQAFSLPCPLQESDSTSATPDIYPLTSIKSHFQNQEAVRLDCFNRTNSKRLENKMVYTLTTLKIYYSIQICNLFWNQHLKITNEIKNAKIKREEDNLLYRGYIMNTLSGLLKNLDSTIYIGYLDCACESIFRNIAKLY